MTNHIDTHAIRTKADININSMLYEYATGLLVTAQDLRISTSAYRAAIELSNELYDCHPKSNVITLHLPPNKRVSVYAKLTSK